MISSILAVISLQADAECCAGDLFFFPNFDTTCCGCGACNIFCCNCDRGCNLEGIYNMGPDASGRTKSCNHWKKKREALSISRNATQHAYKLFKRIDNDEDYAITVKEAYAYITNQTRDKRSISDNYFTDGFIMMDKNKDGMISPNEFDDSLPF